MIVGQKMSPAGLMGRSAQILFEKAERLRANPMPSVQKGAAAFQQQGPSLPFKINADDIAAASAPVIPQDVILARTKELYQFVQYCRDNFDCDADAHTHGTFCRACEAAKILPKYESIG